MKKLLFILLFLTCGTAWAFIDVDAIRYQSDADSIPPSQALAGTGDVNDASKLVTLNCSLKPRFGDRMDIGITIDYVNMKVNGYEAKFYESEIRWTNQRKFNHTLNRLTGFMVISTNERTNILTGYCLQKKKMF